MAELDLLVNNLYRLPLVCAILEKGLLQVQQWLPRGREATAGNRPLKKAGLFRNQYTRYIGNYSGNSGLIHMEGVAFDLKEISASVKPEGNENLVEWR